MSELRVGLLDTNVLIHALTNDSQGAECRRFLEAVQTGDRAVLLTTVVIHEFTYAVTRYRQQMSRQDVADYLIGLMALPAVYLDDEAVFESVRIWANSPGVGFVDAYLAVRAQRDRMPIYTKNIRHFEPFDVDVPNPLDS